MNEQKIYQGLNINPVANPNCIIPGDTYRITLLTSRLIRLEYQEEGKFEDRATKAVINRNFDRPEFRIIDEEDNLEIITEHLHMIYNKKKFSKNGLSIQVKGRLSAYHSVWHFSESFENLKGTTRTLDEADGEIKLEDGLLSRNGFTIMDDSKSILITDDGWVAPRSKETIDIYFFGYGREYLTCLKDFYKLCGTTPMIPRYALGNWWSRFHRYTEESYTRLVNRFEKENIPFSIAVVDMDWHLTEIDPKYGSGWTGYTWNKEFFPNPKRFLSWLHAKGMHVTLNVHPADGVHAHEDAYLEMAKELNVNYEQEDKIQFDISDRRFLNAYFKYLHHPHEDIGVDFWWIDWQQGGSSKIEGLDPLWMLNHYHFMDNGKNKEKPMTFSRYAGLGSHRYPVGFSGDTYATWESLDFQPYFTSTASNAGYGWWSHDIGGHMHGTKSDEMLVRWFQFGVFSPIMRIHSSANPFFVKEPWNYDEVISKILKRFLRLRHQLIPYLYAMNHKCHTMGEPLIQPMYYRNPENEEAYQVPNQYYFGESLIVCPITKPKDELLTMAVFKGWLPDGIYYDIFNGRVYSGNRKIDFYRTITNIPVFAKAGTILPMIQEDSVTNETEGILDFEIKVFAGDNGEFTLFEDDNIPMFMKFDFAWGEKSILTLEKAKTSDGNQMEELPERNYKIYFYGMTKPSSIKVLCEGEEISFHQDYDEEMNLVILTLISLDITKTTVIKVNTDGVLAENNIETQIFDLLNQAQMSYDLKSTIYYTVLRNKNKLNLMGELNILEMPKNLLGALYEIIISR